MIRVFAFLVGLFFSGWLLVSLVIGAANYIAEPPQETAEHIFHKKPKALALASDGAFGNWDAAQLQRGLKVYQEVCAACHSLQYLSFRNFADLGYNEGQVKTLAASWPIEQPSINGDTGEPNTRPNIPSDPIPLPFANNVAAAAANNNAIPPDLSLMAKARKGGAAYIYSLLIGYQDPSAELAERFPDSLPGTGLHHNPYFANLNLAMAPPLTGDGQVSYDDGTPATVDQMAQDVSAFLEWTAEPKLVERKQTGLAVIGFLLIATILAFMSYRNIWADKKH